MLCRVWYHFHNLKNMKNTHGGVLLLAKNNLPPWVFFSCFLNCTNGTKSCRVPKFIPKNTLKTGRYIWKTIPRLSKESKEKTLQKQCNLWDFFANFQINQDSKFFHLELESERLDFIYLSIKKICLLNVTGDG